MEAMKISNDLLKASLEIARKAVIEYVKNSRVISLEEFSFDDKIKKELEKKAGTFVTLEKKEGNSFDLRGCIGFPYPFKSIGESLIESAIEACSRDPRFPPVREEELNELFIEVSILTPPKEIKERSWQGKLLSIKEGEDGVILKNGFYTALFLPQVWEQLSEKEQFLSHLSLKAGLPPHAWKLRNTILYKFRVFSLKDKLIKNQ